LREAINAANANPDASTITFAPNVTNVITLTLGELDVFHDLTILGPGTKVLSISGNNNGRIFNMVAGTIRVSDLTITRGRVVGLTGGAGAVGGGTGGTGGSAFGGGIFNSSVLTLSNCWIVGNAVQGGIGGVGGQDDSTHPAGIGGTGGLGEGGGIYTGVNSLTLINCTISGNSCVGGAAGTGSDAFDNYPSDVGGAGGAVFNTAYLYVTNCTFSGNTCTGGAGGNGGNGYADAVGGAGGAGGAGAGGGIVSTYDFRMASCTISLNSLNGGAGGLGTAGRNGVPPNGSPGISLGGGLYSITSANSVQNSLIAGNNALVAPDCGGFFTSLGYNFVGITNSSIGFANIADQVGNLVTPLNPLLGPLADLGGPTPTIAPLPGSPALDKGNRGVLNADQRGRPRPIDIASIANAPGGDGSDIGAFELSQPSLKIKKVSGNIVLSWSTNDAGFALQSAAQLASPVTWATVPLTPLIVNGEYNVTTNATAGKQFYRLVWAGVGAIPGLFNTGVGSNGAVLASGTIDPHWQLIQSPDPSFPGPNAIVVNDSGFPIPPWLANGPNSKWLAPQANQSTGNQSGDYKYRISFDLTGLEPSTAVINGLWTSDNGGTQVLLNGVATSFNSDGNFTVLGNAFTINAGFVAGVNTLDFVVTNGGPGINPTGVRVELSGTANHQPPP
jgi:hypothetical protein